MKYNQYKHHRRSIRLKGYDYSQPGWYFVTLCTKNREPLFGKIINGKMVQNELGKIAEGEWQKTEEIRKNIKLDQYIVMPNHLHGIIGIVEEEGFCKGTMHRAPTESASIPTIEQYGKPVSGSIPTIVRSYKAAVTKQINILRKTPGAPIWQRNYYERIIRDEAELNRIRKYIIEKPLKW